MHGLNPSVSFAGFPSGVGGHCVVEGPDFSRDLKTQEPNERSLGKNRGSNSNIDTYIQPVGVFFWG